jgi:hypothetical protein
MNQSPAGIWNATYTAANGDSVAGVALVDESGNFYSEGRNLTNGCATVGTGTLTTTGSTVSGTANVGVVEYATAGLGIQTGCSFSDGSTSATETIAGTVVEGSTLAITGTITTSLGTVYQDDQVTATFNNLYNAPSSLASISGNWTGPTGDVLSITATGAMFEQDPTSGCMINGQVSIINASFNAYAATATYSNCQGDAAVLNGLTASGLLTLDNSVSPSLLYAGYSVTLGTGQTIIVVGDATQ